MTIISYLKPLNTVQNSRGLVFAAKSPACQIQNLNCIQRMQVKNPEHILKAWPNHRGNALIELHQFGWRDIPLSTSEDLLDVLDCTKAAQA